MHKLKFIDSLRFMSSSLSTLVNNLSETYSKGCRGCKKRTKSESVCDFIGFKNEKLYHKCNIYIYICIYIYIYIYIKWLKPINGLI